MAIDLPDEHVPSAPRDSRNVLEFLEGLARSAGAEISSIEVRPRPEGLVDAAIFLKGPLGVPGGAGGAFLDLLSSRPEIERARRKGRRISIRFSDDLLASLGADLEEGRDAGLRTGDLLAGRSYIVDFCDPNATKALHVGHLRNLFIGGGLASALAAAGGRVVRQSLVCDIGRSVCEALAGYLEFRPGQDPASAGMKSDHLVGACYSAYVQSLDDAEPSGAGPDAPIARELQARSDLAQRLLERWVAGDREVRDLWAMLRRWVLDGQGQTLERLGIRIDRPLYESECLGRARQVVSRGLDLGIYRGDRDGGIVFETGKREYPTMPLVRGDGFPTEHMRLAAIWYDLQDGDPGLDRCLHVMGDEWVAPITTRELMLRRLRPCPLYDVYDKLAYGMVSYRGSRMKSSLGHGVLIDELLDRLVADPGISRLSSRSGGRAAPEVLARIALAGFFLGRRAAEPVEFSWEGLLDGERNPGWRWAEAWVRVEPDGSHGGGGPAPDDPRYRFAVLASQLFRRRLRLTVSTYDLLPLARYLTRLAMWYLDADAGRLHRVLHAPLRAGLGSLGLLSPGA